MSDQKPLEPRESYFARAASWAEERDKGFRQSRRIAWIVAGLAAAIALIEATALALLIPLKTIIPYTVLVDRHTGHVQVLKGTGIDTIAADVALTEALLAQYVIAREGFDIATISADYQKVALWSSGRERSDYLALMSATNPSSPLQRLPRTTVMAVMVKSVSPLGSNTALVRFSTERRDQGNNAGTVDHWAAVVRYRFAGAPMAFEDRLTNPLGFQVVQYRRNQEAPPPEAAQMPASNDISTPRQIGQFRSVQGIGQ